MAAAVAGRAFHVPPGFEVQLVASEPAIQKPMNLAFDERGRVSVTGSSWRYLFLAGQTRRAFGQPIAAFTKQWDENPVAFRATSTRPTSHRKMARTACGFCPTSIPPRAAPAKWKCSPRA
jgi:hypothetical protein